MTGGSDNGIRADNSGTALTIESAGLVQGGENGVYVSNSGSGELSITTAAVTGAGGSGIYAHNDYNGSSLTITSTDAILGGVYGVVANNAGSDALDITTAAVTGETGDGIRAENNGTSLTIESYGPVQGSENGIHAENVGSGALNVTTAVVTGAGGDGINTLNYYGGTSLTITSTDTIQGGENGVIASNSGSGALSITTAAVTGTSGDGIFAFNGRDGTSLTIDSAGAVEGGRDGVIAINVGSGAVEITTTAVTGGTGDGISASIAEGTSLTINSTGEIRGYEYGISAFNDGDAALSITTADVTGGSRHGIIAANDGTSLAIDTSAGDVSGGSHGIFADQEGTGALTIRTSNVAGANGSGIVAYSSTYDVVTIDSSAGTVSGANSAISVSSDGGGAVSITAGDVSGGNAAAIVVANEGGSTTTVTADGVITGGTGTSGGILVNHGNGGDIDVRAYGEVRSLGDDNAGGGAVYANTTSGDITVVLDALVEAATGTVDNDAVLAITGSGNVSVTVDGTVAGGLGGADEDAVDARVLGEGNIDVTFLGVADEGIRTETLTGDSTVTFGTDANIEGGVSSTSNAGNLVVQGQIQKAGDQSGSVDGGMSLSTGGGDIAVQDIVAIGGDDTSGIAASSTGGGIVINNVGSVSGGAGTGILADARGGAGGTIEIAGIGEVTGATYGIQALTDGNGAIAIDSTGGAVTGGTDGIAADHSGSGALTISASEVTGTSGSGILASSGVNATDLTLTANGNVTGGENGILAHNDGSGTTSVTALGVVTGGTHGIAADHSGSGALTISASEVTGTSGSGILASNGVNATDLTLTANGNVTGGMNGILVQNDGSGATSVTAALDVTGTSGSGLSASNGVNATDLTITSNGNVTGGVNGILAQNFGLGTTSVTASGDVSGGTGIGLSVLSQNGGSITVADGASVTGATSAIVFDGTTAGDATNDVLSLAAGASIDGNVLLNAGDDVFNDDGGAFTAVFGGSGSDVVNFTGDGRSVTGDGLQGFETFNIDMDGLVLAGDHANLEAVNFLSGANTLAGSLETNSATVSAGATLNAADGAVLTGNLTNNGTLNAGDSPGVFTVDGNLVLGDTSVVPIEIGGTSDQIVVTGDLTLGGTLDIINIGTTGLGSTTRTIMGGGTGLSGEFATVNVESGGLLLRQEVVIDVASAEVQLTSTTTTNAASSIDGLSDNQVAVGNNIVNLLSVADLDPVLDGLIWSVGSIQDVDTLAATLTDLTPEGLDVGLRSHTVSQSRFTDLALARAASARNGGVTGWSSFDAYELSQDGGVEHIDFNGTAMSLAAGVSGIESGPVSFGVAGAYTRFDREIDGLRGDESTGGVLHLAGTASTAFGLGQYDARVDTVLAYAAGDQELVMRLIDSLTGNETSQRGDADISSIDWSARFAVDLLGGEHWTLTPYLQTGINIYTQEAVTLGGTAATALEVEELENTRWQVGVGALYEHRIGEQMSIEARVAGVQYFGDTDHVFVSRLALAPADAPTFSTAGRELGVRGQLDAALRYEHRSGYVLSAGVFGEMGDLTVYGVNATLAKRF